MKFLKVLSRILATLAVICLVIVAAGATYNALSLRHYRKLSGVPGSLYNVTRLKLLKIGAIVRVSVRRVLLQLSSAYPWKDHFAQAYNALRC
jgi:hypothetical protein